jgi:hypothetical protein
MTMPKNEHHNADLETLSLDELRQRVDRAKAMLTELDALFPGAVRLTAEDRRTSQGRLRNGESTVLQAVLGAVDSAPQYFVSLADMDQGRDPKRFETDVLRERLLRRDLIDEVSEQLDQLSTRLGDTVLHLGERAAPPVRAAYQIAKVLADSDDQMRTSVAPAIDFYSQISRRAAETRASKKPDPAQGA